MRAAAATARAVTAAQAVAARTEEERSVASLAAEREDKRVVAGTAPEFLAHQVAPAAVVGLVRVAGVGSSSPSEEEEMVEGTSAVVEGQLE